MQFNYRSVRRCFVFRYASTALPAGLWCASLTEQPRDVIVYWLVGVISQSVR